MKRHAALAVLVALLIAAMGACGSDSKVGEGLNTNDLKGKGGTRLGETTTTKAPPTTAKPVPTTRPKPTVAPPTTATAAPIALEIKIQAAAPQFNPAVGQVRNGQVVRWTNADSQTRSVVADSGAFSSPDIPPGGHWDFKANGVGRYNYHDGTRPYAVGELQIV
jgi:plastocyanin